MIRIAVEKRAAAVPLHEHAQAPRVMIVEMPVHNGFCWCSALTNGATFRYTRIDTFPLAYRIDREGD